MKYLSCLEKQQKVKDLFVNCTTEEDRYKKIIELGALLKPLPPEFKVDVNCVHGCQSTLYLRSWVEKGKVFFEAESDALISRGLAYLLIVAYSGEEPEAVLKCPPDFLEELKITASLSPNRASGLYSMHLRMKQDALKILIDQQKNSE